MDVRKAFKVFDRDGSGSLSVDELRQVLTRPGGGQALSEEDVRAIVSQFDASGDGELQYDEFAAMWGFGRGRPRDEGKLGATSSSWFGRFAFRVPGARGSPMNGRRQSRLAGAASKSVGVVLAHAGQSFRKKASTSFRKASSFRRASGGTARGEANATSADRGGASAGGNNMAILSDVRPAGSGSRASASLAAADVFASTKSLSQLAGSTGVSTGGKQPSTAGAQSRPLQPSVQLTALRAEYLQKGADEEARRSSFASLPARLGELLRTRTVDDVVRAWDANGDGEVSLYEFRRSLRDPKLGLHTNVATSEIDELFRKMDTDGGGTLDSSELRVALSKLRRRAKGAAIEEAKCERLAEHWRTRAAQVSDAIRSTEEYEEAERRLREVRIMLGKERTGERIVGTGGGGGVGEVSRVSGALGARLYAAMVQRNMKIGELTAKWDADNDGRIARGEFKAGVFKLVPNAIEEEIDELFDNLDDDSGGELDVNELKAALKKLQDAAAKASQNEVSLVDARTRLRKRASQQQEMLRHYRTEDEVAYVQENAKEMERAAAMAKAEAEAREAKAVAKAERLAREAEEKKRFEANVAMKRAKANKKLDGSKKVRQGQAGGAQRDADGQHNRHSNCEDVDENDSEDIIA